MLQLNINAKLLFVILLIPVFSVCQQKDSLRIYAYYLYGNTKETRVFNGRTQIRRVFATCFFVKQNKNIYIVGAAHTFTGLVHVNQAKDIYYPDTLMVRLYNTNTHSLEDFPFSIGGIKKSVDDSFFYKHADDYVYKINIPKKYIVNAIKNSYLDKKIDPLKMNEAIMYGYPDKDIGVERICILDAKSVQYSQFNEQPTEHDYLYAKLDGIAGTGTSGAPLFFISKDKKVFLAGLCEGGYPPDTLVIVPAKYIIDDLRKKQ